MKLISIDLHRTSKDNIRKFCKKIRLGEEGTKEVLSDKACGFATFWLEISDDKLKLVALNRTANLKKIEFKTDEMDKKYAGKLDQFIKYDPKKEDEIDSMNSETKDIKKPVIEETEVFLTIDDILDKINESGMKSLIKKELDFLKSQS